MKLLFNRIKRWFGGSSLPPEPNEELLILIIDEWWIIDAKYDENRSMFVPKNMTMNVFAISEQIVRRSTGEYIKNRMGDRTDMPLREVEINALFAQTPPEFETWNQADDFWGNEYTAAMRRLKGHTTH